MSTHMRGTLNSGNGLCVVCHAYAWVLSCLPRICVELADFWLSFHIPSFSSFQPVFPTKTSKDAHASIIHGQDVRVEKLIAEAMTEIVKNLHTTRHLLAFPNVIARLCEAVGVNYRAPNSKEAVPKIRPISCSDGKHQISSSSTTSTSALASTICWKG
ncbi:hypothetical protein PIB30_083976 [Stylosanthes scabra]|uniref:Uncharacterized protein n=1 Tax=Stylosanthes scabra TaxID=79078 RepID=A0ABU6USJ4_9FABA|nr:hypothetical protein [Stylosanthes scabra]